MNELTDKGREVLVNIWCEQAELLGLPGPDSGTIDDWIGERSYPNPVDLLNEAGNGSVEALVAIRTEAGLPIFR